MIDLHCHLLPGVDDGAQTLEDGLALARLAVADGIHTACLTPHLDVEHYPHTKSGLLAATHRFQHALDQHGVPLTVKAACEARLSIELLDLVAADEVLFLGIADGYRVLLLEFPHQTIPLGTDRLIAKLFSLKIRPLIAHPERNKAVMTQPEKIYPFVAQGCWLQVTAGSLAGRFGQRIQDVANQLVENDWATVIASDAHDATDRPPVLSEGMAALRRKFGEATANRLGIDNPKKILQGGSA